MFSHFTASARRVMQQAFREAKRSRHDFVGTEHLLYSLLCDTQGPAAALLRTLNVDVESLRIRVETSLDMHSAQTALDRFPLSPATKRVFEWAQDEAAGFRHQLIGPEHLLLGILSDPDCTAAQLLSTPGVSLATARAALAALPIDAREAQIQTDGPRPGGVLSADDLQRHVLDIVYQEGSAAPGFPAVGQFGASVPTKGTSEPDYSFPLSPAVQREIDSLREAQFPTLSQWTCPPLPTGTPAKAKDLGAPIAFAKASGDNLLARVLLITAGCGFLVFAILFAVGAVGGVNFDAGAAPQPALDFSGRIFVVVLIFVVLFVLGLFSGDAWRLILQPSFYTCHCWFCPDGVVWMSQNQVSGLRWEELPGVFSDVRSEGGRIGIPTPDGIRWFSFGTDESSTLLVRVLERKASAALIPVVLPWLAEGKAIPFADHLLDRERLDEECYWRDVVELHDDERWLTYVERGSGKWMIPLGTIPYPSLFVSLARALVAFSREVDAKNGAYE